MFPLMSAPVFLHSCQLYSHFHYNASTRISFYREGQLSQPLTDGVCALVGALLAMVGVLCFVAQKRKTETIKEDSKSR